MFNEEGIRFRKSGSSQQSDHHTKQLRHSEHLPLSTNKDILSKKSVFKEEGIRFKKAAQFGEEGIRFKRSMNPEVAP